MYGRLLWTLVFLGAVVATFTFAWLSRWAVRKWRRARELAALARYRPSRHGAGNPNQPIMVDELVARIQDEGLPVRLNWDGVEEDEAVDGDDVNEHDWPTGILPRVKSEE